LMNGPPVFVSIGVTVFPQLFLNVIKWSAIAGLTAARVTATMVAMRANMVINEREVGERRGAVEVLERRERPCWCWLVERSNGSLL
jgi:hypothetical protein